MSHLRRPLWVHLDVLYFSDKVLGVVDAGYCVAFQWR